MGSGAVNPLNLEKFDPVIMYAACSMSDKVLRQKGIHTGKGPIRLPQATDIFAE
jgi:hypothetical protein